MAEHIPPTSDDDQGIFVRTQRSWPRKFADACRGIKIAMRAEVSFYVHLFSMAIVLLLASISQLTTTAWCLIVLCTVIVLSAEMLNTSIEQLARAVSDRTNKDIRNALDIASGAVLLTAIAAVIIGILVIGQPLWKMIR